MSNEIKAVIGQPLQIIGQITPDSVSPAQLKAVADDLLSHKTDYATYKDSTNLKISKVEKDLNDYQQTMAGVNVNQEPKQKTSGYGIISLPKNAANGQVSATIKGNTETDEEGNIKSTVSASRLKSVSEDESEVSTTYVVAKDEQGKIAELRSLPNGVKDEVRVSEGKATIRIKKHILQESDINRIGVSGNNVDTIITKEFMDMKQGTESYDGIVCVEGYSEYAYSVSGSNWDVVDTLGKFATRSIDKAIRFYVPKGTTLEQAKQQLVGTTLIYQLATPIVTQVAQPQTLISYPSGTIYAEPIIADAGLYTDSMAILNQDLPIKRLDRLSVVDFLTGVETEIDVSQAVIAVDGLSFTHPELADGDIVFFEYEYEYDGTVPEIEAEYYDSRIVKEDKSVPGKFYKIEFEVNNGVVTPIAVEV